MNIEGQNAVVLGRSKIVVSTILCYNISKILTLSRRVVSTTDPSWGQL